MNYELAKELKDAGFPFKNYGTGFDSKGNLESRPIVELSELIEACGEFGFESLIASFGGEWKKYFIAKSAPKTGSKQGTGKTPEEAVAYLYLKLNRDKIK